MSSRRKRTQSGAAIKAMRCNFTFSYRAVYYNSGSISASWPFYPQTDGAHGKRILKLSIALLLFASISLCLAAPGSEAEQAPPPGLALFQKHCVVCHENPASGAPATTVLRYTLTASTIYAARRIDYGGHAG